MSPPKGIPGCEWWHLNMLSGSVRDSDPWATQLKSKYRVATPSLRMSASKTYLNTLAVQLLRISFVLQPLHQKFLSHSTSLLKDCPWCWVSRVLIKDHVCSEPNPFFYNVDHDACDFIFPGQKHSPTNIVVNIYLLFIYSTNSYFFQIQHQLLFVY